VNSKQFETIVSKQPGESRIINFTISTKGKDRDGDVINGPWVLDNYKKNPVVLWSHDYKSLPIGRCTSIGVVNGNLVATALFVDKDLNPLAEQVYNLLVAGFLKATSVGFKPIDPPKYSADGNGLIFGSCELLEFSICTVPSNPDALRRAAKSAGANGAQLTDEQTVRVIVESVLRAEETEAGEIAAIIRAVDKHLTARELRTSGCGAV
jgi:HK97 family phage prohead protease